MVASGRLEIFLEDSANHVFVEVDAEGMGKLFGDARATTPWIAAHEIKNGLNDFRTWAYGSWFVPRLGREEITVFLPHKGRVDSE